MAKKTNKRKPIFDTQPFVRGTGKTFPPKEMIVVSKKGKGESRSINPKQALVIDNINDFFKKATGYDKKEDAINPAIYLAAMQMIQMTKDDNPVEHEATKERIFRLVTYSCNSNGVNKMGIVNSAAAMIQTERVARLKAEKKVKSLEDVIRKFNITGDKDVVETYLDFMKNLK